MSSVNSSSGGPVQNPLLIPVKNEVILAKVNETVKRWADAGERESDLKGILSDLKTRFQLGWKRSNKIMYISLAVLVISIIFATLIATQKIPLPRMLFMSSLCVITIIGIIAYAVFSAAHSAKQNVRKIVFDGFEKDIRKFFEVISDPKTLIKFETWVNNKISEHQFIPQTKNKYWLFGKEVAVEVKDWRNLVRDPTLYKHFLKCLKGPKDTRDDMLWRRREYNPSHIFEQYGIFQLSPAEIAKIRAERKAKRAIVKKNPVK